VCTECTEKYVEQGTFFGGAAGTFRVCVCNPKFLSDTKSEACCDRSKGEYTISGTNKCGKCSDDCKSCLKNDQKSDLECFDKLFRD
jgi:hypothetical protein